MSKKLNEAAMKSELSGSAFFREESAPVRRDNAPDETTTERTAVRPPAKPDATTPVPSSVLPPARSSERRVITRYSFEFYQDQVARLRALSLQEKLQGEAGSMSEMVRHAIDAYLAQREEGDGRESARSG